MKTNYKLLAIVLIYLGLFTICVYDDVSKAIELLKGFRDNSLGESAYQKNIIFFDAIHNSNAVIKESKVSPYTKLEKNKVTFLKKNVQLFQDESTAYDAQRRVLWDQGTTPDNFMGVDALVSVVNTGSNRQNKIIKTSDLRIGHKYMKGELKQSRMIAYGVIAVMTLALLLPLLYLFGELKKNR